MGTVTFPGWSQNGNFSDIVFVDHGNLRVNGVERDIRNQVDVIKKNLDQAAAHGATTYLIFSKDYLDATLTYDFDLNGVGRVGELAYPPQSKRRGEVEYLRKALQDVCAHAKKKKIRIVFHSEQLNFPNKVKAVIEPVTWGTSACPGRRALWNVYRGKLEEFFKWFPGVDGIQITADEAPYPVLTCFCDECRKMSPLDRINLLTKETALVCEKLGKETWMRTWQRMGALEKEKSPAQMAEGLPDSVFFSVKNTAGDFLLPNPVDEKFLRTADPKRLIVEFDAWREYEGHNYFPCYMGDVWAPRFALLQELGVQRVAVRLMWNNNANSLFERIWSNYVNLHTFLELAKNPKRNPDEILQEFVAKNYPASARQAAFELYKFSPELQKGLYYPFGRYNANHSRVQDKNAATDLKDYQANGHFSLAADFSARREEILVLCSKADAAIDRLGKDVSAAWIKEMKKGLQVEKNVALGTTYKMQALFLQQNSQTAELNTLWEEMKRFSQDWQKSDPESFLAMNGDGILKVGN